MCTFALYAHVHVHTCTYVLVDTCTYVLVDTCTYVLVDRDMMLPFYICIHNYVYILLLLSSQVRRPKKMSRPKEILRM